MNFDRPLRFTGRSSSHFTRVAAIFAHELGLPFTLDVVYDLTRTDTEVYGGNPALKVPTLHLGESVLFGTENICRKLVEIAGRAGDARILLSEQLGDDLVRCAQELVWHTMSAQVQLRVGIKVCKLPADNPFFAKARAGMEHSLAWLDSRLNQFLGLLPAARDLSLLEVTLFCMYEHIAFLPTVSLEPYANLKGFVARFAGRESARRTPFHFDPVPETPKDAP